MRGFVQMVCVFAIAVGAGLFSFGNHLDPPVNVLDPATLAHSLEMRSNDRHMSASIASGVGIGFMILGTLGLIIPWANGLALMQFRELGENSTRLIGAVVIWLSVALILTFGVLRLNWTGSAAMCVMLILVAMICAAATVCTALLCGWKPWMPKSPSPLEAARQPVP